MPRAASKVDEAAVYCLKVQTPYHRSRKTSRLWPPRSRACADSGIDMPAHPTEEQVQAEYETVWQTLDGRPIESLIDLPLMTDPELQAAMQMLSAFRGSRLLYRLPFVSACRYAAW